MKRFLIIILVVSLVIAGFVSWFASSKPDGLERVAEDQGFIEKAEDTSYEIFPDYKVPGVNKFLSKGLAGVIGTLATFGLILLLGKIIYRKKGQGDSGAPYPY